jgi:hypothetical protein
MKKAAGLLIALAAVLVTAGCSQAGIGRGKNKAGTQSVIIPAGVLFGVQQEPPLTFGEGAAADASWEMPSEFVEIKEKMFITQTNDIYLNAEDYLGKTVKLEGIFKSYQAEGTDYCFVIRYGPGCCGNDGNAGFEVAWQNPKAAVKVNKTYPQEDEWVEAVGILESYVEDEYPYLIIRLASLNVKRERGAEFVTQ